MPLSFLTTKPVERVEIPVSSGEFQPSGLIAPFVAAPMYWVLTRDLTRADLVERGLAPNAEARKGEWTQFYFLTQATAQLAVAAVKEASGEKYDSKKNRPNQCWRFETHLASVLNISDENKQKFLRDGEAVESKVLAYEVDMTSLRPGNKKYPVKTRHAFHLIALPAAVAAVGRALGQAVEFDLSELLSNETVFDDEFAARFIGPPDGGYQDSVLWQRRVALWKALGEDDPAATMPIGYGTGKETTSQVLSQALSIFANPWGSAEWLRLVGVPDPRVDAVHNDNRLKINVVTEIFASDTTAKAAADEELAAKASKAGTSGAKATTPPVPAAYAALADDWVTYLRSYVSEGKPNPVIAKEMSVTPGDVSAWREHLGI